MKLRKELGSKNRKDNAQTKPSKVRRYLSTFLLSTGIAIAGCGDNVTPCPDNGDGGTVCTFEAGPKVYCDSENVLGTLGVGETLSVGNIGIRFEDAELHSETNQAIISIIDSDCNVLLKDKITEGQTLTITVNGESLDVKATEVAAGSSPDSTWATLEVSASGCEEVCEPPEGCREPNQTTVVTLAEGENTTVDGTTCRILEITEDVSAPQQDTCAILNERVELQIEHPTGWTFTITLPEGDCLQMQEGCLSVEVLEITETVGAPVGNTCPVTDERVRVAITQPLW